MLVPAFSPFPKMFATIPKTDFNFLVIFILSSASALNLYQSKIFSFGKGLWRKEKSFENIVGKGENAGTQHFLLFKHCFQPIKRQISQFELYLICHLKVLSFWASRHFMLFGKRLLDATEYLTLFLTTKIWTCPNSKHW